MSISKRKRSRVLLAAMAAVSGMGFGVAKASATTLYWDSNGTTPGAGVTPTGTWGTSAFWSTDPAGTNATTGFTLGSDVVFSAGTDAVGTFTVTASATQTAGVITVEEGNISFAGSALNTGTNALIINAGAQVNIPTSLQLNSAGSVVLDGGTLFETNPGNAGSLISSNRALVITANGGTVGYNDGAGTNSFVTIYSGPVQGVGGTITNGGVGTFTKTGPDEYRVQGFNTTNSTFAKLVVNQGLFRVGATATPANGELAFGAAPLSFLADAITLNGGSIGDSLALTLNSNRGVTIGSNGGSFYMSGAPLTVPSPISGSGKLIVTGGSQLLTISSASNVTTFTGALQVDGTVTFSQSFTATNFSSTGTAGVVTISSGKTLTVGGDGTSTTYMGKVGGTGGIFTKSGTGTLTIANNGWTNSGLTNIDAGTLKYNDTNAGLGNSSTINIAANATLDMNMFDDTIGNLSGAGIVTNGGNLNVGGNLVNNTFSGTIYETGTFTKAGTGNLTLSGSNAISGNIAAANGTLTVTANQALGFATNTTTVSFGAALAFDASVNYTATNTVNVSGTGPGGNGAIIGVTGTNYFAGAVNLLADSQANVGSGSSLELNGPISGAFTLTVQNTDATSTMILSGDNSNLTTGLTVNNGTLGIASDNSLGAPGINLTFNNLSTLLAVGNVTSARDLNLGGAAMDALPGKTMSLSGNVTFSGDLTKGSNTGTVQLAQSGGYTVGGSGNINVLGGTLAVGDPVNGVTGPLTVPGTLSVSDGASAVLLPATGMAVTHTINSLNLNSLGKLDVGNSSFYTTTSTSTIQSYLKTGYNGGAWNGTGAAIVSTSANLSSGSSTRSLGYASSTDSVAGSVIIPAGQTLVKYTTPGDADLSGNTDFNDFLALQNAYNKPGNWSQGDFDYTGTVDFNDFLILQNNYNHSLNANGTVAGGSAKSALAKASSLTASPSVPTATVTYVLSPNDDGHGNFAAGKFAVYAIDSTADGNHGMASFSVDVQGATLVTNFAPKGTYDDGTNTGNTVAEGFTLLRTGNGAFSTLTDPAKSSQDTVDASGVQLIYGMGQLAGNLNSQAPAGSSGGTGKVQPTYAAELLVMTGTFSGSSLAFNTDMTFDKANVFLTGSTADTEAAGITLTTAGVPEPTTLSLMALAAGGLLGRRKRRSC